MQVFKKRAVALAIVVQAGALYSVAELVHAVRGSDWHRLEVHLDRVDDRMTDAEDACRAAGDDGFVEWLGNATDRFTDKVSAMTAWWTKEPVR